MTCQLGALAAGAAAQVTITVEVAADAAGTLRNVASVEGPEPDPDHANNESAVEGPVAPAPPIAPRPARPRARPARRTCRSSRPPMTPPRGRPALPLHVTVSNRGGGEAKNVRSPTPSTGRRRSPIDAAGKCDAGRPSPHHLPDPGPGAGRQRPDPLTVVAERAGPLTNEASAMAGNGEVAPADNHAVKDVTAMAAPASYTLTKTAARKIVPGGQEVGFTIAVRNGPTAMTDVTMCDRLPASLVFVKAPGASSSPARPVGSGPSSPPTRCSRST